MSPSNAKIYLDDMLLSVGTFDGKVVKSDKPAACGRRPRTTRRRARAITLTEDLIVSFALERDAVPPPSPAAYIPRSRPAPEPQVAQPVSPVPTPVPAPAPPPQSNPQKPKRGIDSDSPYAQ